MGSPQRKSESGVIKKKNFYLKNTVLEKWQMCRGEMRLKCKVIRKSKK
jgi:hypothetical protein